LPSDLHFDGGYPGSRNPAIKRTSEAIRHAVPQNSSSRRIVVALGLLLSDGFEQDGNPDFTFDFGFGGATQPFFNGVASDDDPRTGDYVFHILNVESASHQPPSRVPDATSTVGLPGLALLGLAAVKRRIR
jgi:hypothetical protein